VKGTCGEGSQERRAFGSKIEPSKTPKGYYGRGEGGLKVKESYQTGSSESASLKVWGLTKKTTTTGKISKKPTQGSSFA